MTATEKWLRAALVRAVKTMAQAALGTIGAAAFLGDVSWGLVASAAALSGACSLLTSVAGLPEADGGQSLPEIVANEDKER